MKTTLLKLSGLLLVLFLVSNGSKAQITGKLSPAEESRFVEEMVSRQRIGAADAKIQLEKYEKALAAESGKVLPIAASTGKTPKIQSSCTNLDFGTGDTTGWKISGDYKIVSSGVDTFGGCTKVPAGSKYALQLGNYYIRYSPYPPAFAINSSAQQTFNVSASDPVIMLQYAVSILEFGHLPTDAAFVKIEVLDSLGDAIACSRDSAFDAPGGPSGFTPSAVLGPQNNGPFAPGTYTPILYPTTYLPWKKCNIDLSSYIGQSVTLVVTSSWCRYNYDWAYCYFSGSCSPANKMIQTDSLTNLQAGKICAPAGMISYKWAGPSGSGVTGDTTQCISTNVAGTYSVTCGDFSNCTANFSLTIDKATSTGIAVGGEDNRSVKIFPNPTDNQFTIVNKLLQTSLLQVFDVEGKLVLARLVNPGSTLLEAGFLAPGVYNVCFCSQSERTNLRLVIIR